MLGSYLLVQPSFDVFRDVIDSAVVWIRLPNLPLHLYHEKMLCKIGSSVGRIIKMDTNTSDVIHGKFARISVSINLKTPLTSKVNIKNRIQIIEYENLL